MENNFKEKFKNCVACGKEKIKKVATIKSNQYYVFDPNVYYVYECEICKLLFVNPMPTNEFLDYYYNNLFNHDFIIRPQRKKENEKIIKKMFDCIEERAIEFNQIRFYEIGIGKGDFIKQISEYGIEVSGNDLSEKMASKKFSFPIDTKRFEDSNYENIFDIVYSSHVLEHSNDPKKFVKAIYKSLKPKGIAVIRVPNRYSSYFRLGDLMLGPHKWVNYMPAPDHLIVCSKKSLEELFLKNGFIIKEIINLPEISTLLVSYLSIIVRSYMLRIMPIFGINIKPSSLIKRKNGKPSIMQNIFLFLLRIFGPIDKLYIILTWPIFKRLDLGDELFLIAQKVKL